MCVYVHGCDAQLVNTIGKMDIFHTWDISLIFAEHVIESEEKLQVLPSGTDPGPLECICPVLKVLIHPNIFQN